MVVSSLKKSIKNKLHTEMKGEPPGIGSRPTGPDPQFEKHCLRVYIMHSSCFQIIHLRGRGITGLSRNILVESILEKFKYELENLHTKEQKQLSQICQEHGENMSLV